MEPERPIEKLLRAFSGKRRHEAGAPLDLHPATRRLLQGEVARRTRSAPGGFWSRIFTPMRPGLVYVVCTAIVLAVAVLLVPQLREGEREIALSERHRLSSPAPEAFDFDAVEARGEPVVSEVNRRVNGAGAVTNRDDFYFAPPAEGLAKGSIVLRDAESATGGPSFGGYGRAGDALRAEAAQDGFLEGIETATVAPGRAAANANAESQQQEVTASAPPVVGSEQDAVQSRQSNAAELPQALGGASLARARRESRTQAFEQTHFVSLATNAMPVLNGFRLQQGSNWVRVVDGDGSVYTSDAPARAGGGSGDIETPPPGRYTFRVAGTNRTLNEPVVFTGTLIGSNRATPYFRAGTPLQESLLPLRIEGTIALGNRPEVEITAESTMVRTNQAPSLPATIPPPRD